MGTEINSDEIVPGVMSLEQYIKHVNLQDMQGRTLLLGDWVTSIHGHFVEAEIMGVVDYQDGYGLEFLVRVDNNNLRNAGSHALQFVRR